MKLTTRIAGALLGSAGALVLVPGVASAHPLGNFTVNRYTGVVLGADSVRLDHVVDVAEIPTAQRMPALDRDGSGQVSGGELSTYARVTCAVDAAALRVVAGGRAVPVRVASSAASLRDGQAGLPTLRVTCELTGPLSVRSPTQVTVVDEGAGDEVGWRELTAVGDGTTLLDSDVPARSKSRRLTRYPADLLSSPLDVRAAHLTVRPGGPALVSRGSAAGSDVADVPGAAGLVGTDRVTRTFEGAITRYDGSPWLAAVGVLVALALGAAHAVAPGHGKTIMAFYLSGRREGAVRAAGTVAATVTVTHTAGVLLLGVLVSAGTGFVPARLYPWLTLLSGLLVIAVGATLLRASRRTHGHSPGHDHPHPHGHDHPHRPTQPPVLAAGQGLGVAPPATLVVDRPRHDHDDEPEHDHDHGHDRHDDDHQAAPTSRRGLVAMGVAGGLLPSPSALLVFLGALAVGHPWLGVALVVAFGLGMATTLAAVGLLVSRLRDRVESRLAPRRVSGGWGAAAVRALPVVTACAVVLLGVAAAARGLSGLLPLE